MGKVFRILSIDGGGIRGVYPAHILRCIEERLKINIFNTFDMIAGTSTGAIIAAGLASGLPAVDLVQMYQKHGDRIFCEKPSFWPVRNWSWWKRLVSGAYQSQYLESVLNAVFQGKKMGDIRKPLLLPSTDIGNGTVHVLKSGYCSGFTRDPSVLVKDAVLASCAAPTYFDPLPLKEYLLADGGLWANNPALAAVIEAKNRLKISQDDLRILSIGTGHSKTMYRTKAHSNWGLLTGWRGRDFIGFLFSLQSQSAWNYLKLMLHKEQIRRIDFETDCPLPLDDVSIMEKLISRADRDFTCMSDDILDFISAD